MQRVFPMAALVFLLAGSAMAEEVPVEFRKPVAVARIAPRPPTPKADPSMDDLVKEAVVFESPVCDGGLVANETNEYHCCWPGQIWDEGACYGEPVCPSGHIAVDEQCTHLPALVRVQSGTVTVGSPRWEPDRSGDEVQREVYIAEPFQMTATEVTQELWERVMGANPVEDCASQAVHPDYPVFCVSWNDSVNFANELSRLTGLEPVYSVREGGVSWRRDATGFRLPTEAEWETAARAGTSTMYAGSDYLHLVGWSAERAGNMVQPVSSLQPNEGGLYDMSGNVSEWVWDAYKRPVFGKMPDDVDDGRERVVKGGSWYDPGHWHRIAARSGALPTTTYTTVGLRLVRNLN